jgi:hypothetical protein
MNENKPWLKSGIQRLDGAGVSCIRESESLYREAIRGEANLGEYGRTALEGAAGGAVGGALVGGVGAAPGALIGAAGNVGVKGVTDLWYATRSDEDKAAWQAGDLEDKLNKITGLIQDKNSSLASILIALGNQYKEFIDGFLQGRKSESYKQNRFNLSPEEQQQKFGEEYNNLNRLRQPVATTKFRRVAANPNYFNPNTVNDTHFGYGHDTASSLGQFGTDMLSGTAGGNIGEFGAKKATQKLAPQLLKGVGNLKTLGVGLVGELAAGSAIDWAEGLQGQSKLFQSYSSDVEKIITEINRLSKNNPQVIAAGNQIWSYVQQAQELLANAAPPAQTPNASPVPAQTQVAAHTKSTFKRS